MAKSKRTGWRKWLNYFLNTLLAVVLIILIVPSWRVGFQTWFQSLTLEEVEFESNGIAVFPENQRNWELIDPEGTLMNFAEFKGKPIVISFWATWCGACRSEFPDLGRLRNNWKDEVAFAAVTTESLDVLNESGYPDSYDFVYATQEYPPFFDVRVYPTLAILDKEMNMVYRMEGAADLNNDNNVAFINELLEKP